MTITYNNEELQSNIITFSDIPNILKVEDESGGTYATMTFTFSGNLASVTETDGQWYVTFMGETITNVLNPSNAVNKNFFIKSGSNDSTAASVARALRNCPTIAANFNIEHSSASVIMTAKAVGQMNIQNSLDYNISSTYFSAVGNDGEAYSELYGSKIDVDVYKNGEYVTTLEKNWYGGEAAFNMSPVITTFAEYGSIVPYTMKVSSILDGEYNLLGNISTNYASIGYMVNQGEKYLDNSMSNIAMNYSRGAYRAEIDNNTILYLYKPEINISLYTGNEGGFYYQIDYLDSSFNRINGNVISSMTQCQSNSLIDLTYELNHSGGAYFPLAFYVDLTLGTKKVRFNVIKPLKATEYYQRIYWRNSYGGISFVDLTGEKTVTKDLNIDTYEKNMFDYYTSEINSLEKVYDVNVKDTYTLKSHLMEADGRWVYNDLAQSAMIWTEVNGEKYEIILDSISVDETDNNDIYQATVKFHFSQPTTLI